MILPDAAQFWQELAHCAQAQTQGVAKRRAIPKLCVSAGRLRTSLPDERAHIRSPFRAPGSSRQSPSWRIGSRMFGRSFYRQAFANVKVKAAIFLDPKAPTWARFAQSSSSGEQTCHRSKFLSPPAAWPSLPGAKCQQTASVPPLARALVPLVPQRLAATSLQVLPQVRPRARCATTSAFAANTTGLATHISQHRARVSSRGAYPCPPASHQRCAGLPRCQISQRTAAHV